MYRLYNSDKVKALADSIREKTGKTDLMYPGDMDTEIESIVVNESAVQLTKDQYLNGISILYDNIATEFHDSFQGDNTLTEVNLPNITTISNINAFAQCINLTTVNLPNLLAIDTYFLKCTNLKQLRLPKVTSYTNNAFRFGLQLLDLGQDFVTFNTVSGTSTSPFYYSHNLETLILRSLSVVTIPGMSETGVKYNTLFCPSSPIALGAGYIYVPKLLVSDYCVTYPWSQFAEQVRAIEDYPDICEL